MATPDIAPLMQVDVFSHSVKVSHFMQAGKSALLEYCRGLAQFGLVKVDRTRFESRMLRVFVGVTVDRSEFHFHRNQWNDLRQHLNRYGFTERNVLITIHELYEPLAVEFPLKDTRPPREKQIPLIEYLKALCLPGYAPAKVATLQTGGGKTFCALNAIHHIGHRTVLVIKGMYVAKWIEDVRQAYDIGIDELMVVRGSKHMRALQELALAGVLNAKFIIITLNTVQDYLEAYEKYHHSELFPYPVKPEEFYPLLRAGVRLIDEVHQSFHCNFRQDLYTHIPKTMSLSATLDSDDPFMNRMYEINWPLNTRAPEVEYHKFIVMKCLWYTLREPRKLRYKNFMRQYSHVMFEQSLMKHPEMLRNYINMITEIVNTSYIRVRQDGQKMLIFCATIEFCTILRNHLAVLMPSLKVNRYVGEDEYDVLLDADIAVSTLLSAGTAVDIPNLRISLMTNALSSKQANIQMLGRTRPLRDWPDVTPECLFLACREIDKHVQYAQQKAEKLDGKVLAYKDIQTPFRI